MTSRRRVLLFAGGLAGVFIAAPLAYGKYRGTDVLGQLSPTGGWGSGGLMDQYPIGSYQLDTHISTGTLGTNFSAYPAVIADFFATVIWEATVWWMVLAIALFGWAQDQNFVT